MGIRTKRITGGNGIDYSKELDSPLDWSGVTNNTYFKDLSDGLIYWKNLSGTVIAIYELAGLTGATDNYTTGTTVVGTTVYFDRTDSLSAYTANLSAFTINNWVQTTYNGITGLTSTNALIPGTTYVFPYETMVGVAGTGLLNIGTPGYTPIVENLAIKASGVNTFFEEASSIENPEDKIMYDINLNNISGTTRPGLIYWRKDVDNDIEAYFDVRNNIVARYEINPLDVAYVSGPVDRGEIVYDASLWKMSVRDGSDRTNFRLVPDISKIDQTVYFNDSVNLFQNTINYIASAVTYHQSIDGLGNSSIKIGKGCTDIMVNTANDVIIDEDVSKVSILEASTVRIGKNSSNIMFRLTDSISCGDKCNEIYAIECSGNTIEKDTSKILLIDTDYNDISKGNTNVFIQDSPSNQIGSQSSSIMLIRNSNYTKIDADCGGISIANSIRNRFASGCVDIEIYSGGHNRFAQSCNVINLLGEKDDFYTGGTYNSPYSEMAYNTFGVGCSNITFDILGGRGNQFGDECRNLLFTNSASTQNIAGTMDSTQWRLIGTHWVRGIQNKTFEEIIHGCSFLVPDQVEATITTDDWFSQVLSFNTYNSSPSYVIELGDEQVTNLETYSVNITTLGTSTGPSQTGGTAQYLSSTGATKEEITSGMTAAINSTPSVSGHTRAIQAGNRIYITSILATGFWNGPRTITVDGGTYLDAVALMYLPIWVTQKVSQPNSRDNRVFQESLTGAYMSGSSMANENQIAIDYASIAQPGGGGFPANGAVNTDGNYITEMRIRDYPTGKAFMFTKSGHPLSMTFNGSVNGAADPTGSLNK